jgi:hypothetical protein
MTGEAGTWVVAGLELAAALGIGAFWMTWFREKHGEEWLPEGYVQHERVFVFPDSALALLLVASAILLVTDHPLGRSLSLVCAGMLAFLGILDAAYFWQTGLFARERGGGLNAAVVVAMLTLAVVLVVFFISQPSG